MTSRDRIWAFSLVARFLQDSGYEHTLEMLRSEAPEAFEDVENAVLPTSKPLLALLDDVKYTTLKQDMDQMSLGR